MSDLGQVTIVGTVAGTDYILCVVGGILKRIAASKILTENGYQGLAILTTNPGTPLRGDWYICNVSGTFTNFGAQAATKNDRFYYNGATWDLVLFTNLLEEGYRGVVEPADAAPSNLENSHWVKCGSNGTYTNFSGLAANANDFLTYNATTIAWEKTDGNAGFYTLGQNLDSDGFSIINVKDIDLLIQGTVITGETTLLTTSDFGTASDFERSDYIPVLEGETISVTAVASTGNPVKGYDINKVWVSDLYLPSGSRVFFEEVEIIIPSGISFVVACSAFDNTTNPAFPISPLLISISLIEQFSLFPSSLNNLISNGFDVALFNEMPVTGIKLNNSNGNIYGSYGSSITGDITIDLEGIKNGGIAVLVWSGSTTPVFITDLEYTLIGDIYENKIHTIYIHYFLNHFIVNIIDGSEVVPLKTYFEFLEANTDQVDYEIAFDANQEFYVETVCKLKAKSIANPTQSILGAYDTSYTGTFRCLFGVYTSSNTIFGSFENFSIASTETLSLDTWVKLKMVFDPITKYVKLYINGIFVNESSMGTITSNTFTFPIGKSQIPNTNADWDIDYIDFNGVKFEFNAIFNGTDARDSEGVDHTIISDRADITTILNTEV